MDGRAEGPGPCITALNPGGSVLHLWAWNSHFWGEILEAVHSFNSSNCWLLGRAACDVVWGKTSLALGWDMKKWSFQIPNSSAVAGNDGEGERVGFEASSTSQFMSREVLGMQSSSGMLVAVPGAIKGRRSTGSALAQQHSLPPNCCNCS